MKMDEKKRSVENPKKRWKKSVENDSRSVFKISKE
jgi:hypothetical protein